MNKVLLVRHELVYQWGQGPAQNQQNEKSGRQVEYLRFNLIQKLISSSSSTHETNPGNVTSAIRYCFRSQIDAYIVLQIDSTNSTKVVVHHIPLGYLIVRSLRLTQHELHGTIRTDVKVTSWLILVILGIQGSWENRQILCRINKCWKIHQCPRHKIKLVLINI